jgi:hypothetical protein
VYGIVLYCIVVPLPPGPLAVNNNIIIIIIIRGFTKPDLTFMLNYLSMVHMCFFKFIFTVLFIIAVGAAVVNSYF